MKATVEIVQCRAMDLDNGETIRLPGDPNWYLLVEAIIDDSIVIYKDDGVIEQIVNSLDEWMVVLMLNDVSNVLRVDDDDRVVDPRTGKPYDRSGPPWKIVPMFENALVDVQVRHEITVSASAEQTEGRSA